MVIITAAMMIPFDSETNDYDLTITYDCRVVLAMPPGYYSAFVYTTCRKMLNSKT